jgi:hypothetical protein
MADDKILHLWSFAGQPSNESAKISADHGQKRELGDVTIIRGT